MTLSLTPLLGELPLTNSAKPQSEYVGCVADTLPSRDYNSIYVQDAYAVHCPEIQFQNNPLSLKTLLKYQVMFYYLNSPKTPLSNSDILHYFH